jgi:hypothetical protein
VTLQPNSRMKWFRHFAVGFAIAFMLASCGEPERARPAALTTHAARAGGEFDEIGTVRLYPGESCTSQIMFIFHTERSTSISLAAPWRESTVLKDAIHRRRQVRVIGKWRRGSAPDCYYVEASQVEIQKSFW